MRSIDVKTKSSNYQILIGQNMAFEALDNFLAQSNYSSVLIVTDSNVKKIYGEKILKMLIQKGYIAFIYVIEQGEGSKSIKTASEVWSYCLENGIDRSCGVIALGGGVVGDLTGFIASTYMRGIDYIQVPTTLMAMVDSSVGGKVAINLDNIKNVVGSFYQPKRVIIDSTFLKTLPRQELISGLGEVIKYGLIRNYDFFTYIRENYKELLKINLEQFIYVIDTCCRYKADIVSTDERENNIRAILNFGHTIGHGIESCSEMSIISHGEAVAMGIVYESKIALAKGLIDKKYYEEIIDIVRCLGLLKRLDINIKQIMEVIAKDKKNVGSNIRMILPTGRGQVEIFDNINQEIIKKSIEEEVYDG